MDRSRLILASSSPRRKALLEQIGIPFKVEPSTISEKDISHYDPEEQAAALAERKAREMASIFVDSVVLAADTLVVLDRRVLGKPENFDEAVGMLKSLSGRTHEVMTGLSLQCISEGIHHSDLKVSTVEFRELSTQAIKNYVDSGECYDKAGGYGIQEKAAVFVKSVQGSYTNVVGLPLELLVDMLLETGLAFFLGTGWN